MAPHFEHMLITCTFCAADVPVIGSESILAQMQKAVMLELNATWVNGLV